jgi:hypothetical protein
MCWLARSNGVNIISNLGKTASEPILVENRFYDSFASNIPKISIFLMEFKRVSPAPPMHETTLKFMKKYKVNNLNA